MFIHRLDDHSSNGRAIDSGQCHISRIFYKIPFRHLCVLWHLCGLWHLWCTRMWRLWSICQTGVRGRLGIRIGNLLLPLCIIGLFGSLLSFGSLVFFRIFLLSRLCGRLCFRFARLGLVQIWWTLTRTCRGFIASTSTWGWLGGLDAHSWSPYLTIRGIFQRNRQPLFPILVAHFAQMEFITII